MYTDPQLIQKDVSENTNLPLVEYAGIINTIDRDTQMVERSLRSFLNQNPPPNRLYLIDQNSTPITLSNDLNLNPRLIRMNHRVPSVGLARNFIPESEDTPWLVFCDDDGFLANDYMEQFKLTLDNNPNLELIAGPYINETDGKYYSIRHSMPAKLSSAFGSKLMLGSNFCIRATTYNKIGRYDGRFGPGSKWPSSDETDLVWRAISQKVKMKYVPTLKVFHPPAFSGTTLKSTKKAYWYGIGKGALVAKWIFERPSWLGYWELIEMNIIPLLNIFRGALSLNLKQIPIQIASIFGRYKGFMDFTWRLVSRRSILKK